MPMAGAGSRFADAGFALPKPLILVDKLPMFRKAISSLDGIHADKTFYFIIRQEHVDKQQLDQLIKDALPEANVIVIAEMTRGAAETAYAVKNNLSLEDAAIIMDCDLWFNSISYNSMVEEVVRNTSDVNGGLLTFPSDNPRYSYAKTDENGIVTETAEKVVISNDAITGAYFFSTARDFLYATEELMKKPLNEKMPEYYMSLLYNILINEGKKFKAAKVDQFSSFGTPEELAEYENSK